MYLWELLSGLMMLMRGKLRNTHTQHSEISDFVDINFGTLIFSTTELITTAGGPLCPSRITNSKVVRLV